MTPGSSVEDGGFNQMAAEALEKLAADPTLDVGWTLYNTYSAEGAEGADVTAEEGYAAAIAGVAAEGRPGDDLLVFLGFDFDAAVAAAAVAHPSHLLVQVDSCPPNKASVGNVVCALFAEEQVAFAAGALAALASSSGVVGGVFGAPLGPLLRFEQGFKAGARHAVPGVAVETQFVHDFGDLAAGAAVAEHMVASRGADVIFGAAGGTSIGALNWCLAHNVSAIGVDSDQFHAVYGGDAQATPGLGHLLSSAQKAVGAAVERVAREFAEGTLAAAAAEAAYTFDYSNGGVKMAPCHLACDKLSLKQRSEVDAVQTKLAAGLVKAPLDGRNLLALYDKSSPPMPPFSWAAASPYGRPPAARYARCSLSLAPARPVAAISSLPSLRCHLVAATSSLLTLRCYNNPSPPNSFAAQVRGRVRHHHRRLAPGVRAHGLRRQRCRRNRSRGHVGVYADGGPVAGAHALQPAQRPLPGRAGAHGRPRPPGRRLPRAGVRRVRLRLLRRRGVAAAVRRLERGRALPGGRVGFLEEQRLGHDGLAVDQAPRGVPLAVREERLRDGLPRLNDVCVRGTERRLPVSRLLEARLH
jgi:basic membrane protein A